VVSSSPTPDGGITLTLSNDEQVDADMYIPAFGLSPNSSYIPSKFLDDKGYVEVDMNLRVKGAEDVWAIGDVSALEWNQYLACRAQALYLSKNFGLILKGKVPAPYKISTRMYFYLRGVKRETNFTYRALRSSDREEDWDGPFWGVEDADFYD
jgi:NADH dehydrogenase FAD-containing subunit